MLEDHKVHSLSPSVEAASDSLGSLEKTRSQESESVQVSLDRLDRLMSNVGELVILQKHQYQSRHLLHSKAQLGTVNQMEKIIREVQEITMSLRMVPLEPTFERLRRNALEAAAAMSKETELTLHGGEIEVDRNVLGVLGDSLERLVRHAIESGLEEPELRANSGKPRAGKIALTAFHAGGSVVIEVSDDGKGASTIDLEDIKKRLAAVKGEISFKSEPGKGSTSSISIPLALSILDAMVVRLGDETFAIPVIQIAETVEVRSTQVVTVGTRGKILKLRDENLPIRPLSQLLGKAPESASGGVGIVSRGRNQEAHCVLVDGIVAKQQIVISKLGREIRWLRGVIGAAILGDGQTALILDLEDLLRVKGSKSA